MAVETYATRRRFHLGTCSGRQPLLVPPANVDMDLDLDKRRAPCILADRFYLNLVLVDEICLRWTAVMVKPGEWKWIENGVPGKWPKEARQHLSVIVIYRWPEMTETYVTDLSDREKGDILRCHLNLGHPNTREFVRLLKAAGSRHDVAQYVLREFQCPGCVKERKPPTRLPAAHPALVTWLAFTRLWLRVFGAPQYLMFDEGRDFAAATFQDGLERRGIIPLEVARNAPFTNGVVERRGGLVKEVYYRTRELVQPTTLEAIEIDLGFPSELEFADLDEPHCQVFKMSVVDQAGIEAIPAELLQPKLA
ncbi:unnamed protein product [Symbiodinium sp. CCMP2456]|nr:unnamed protein product [Symbiodinium sp. CCMP2456]